MELLPSALDTQLGRDAGLSFTEFLVLLQLADGPDRTLRLTDLAASVNAGLPRTSRMVARLEQAGLVRREVAAGDARSRLVSLTPEGWTRLSEAAPPHVALVRKLVMDRLTSEQLGQLAEITTVLAQGLDPARRVLGSTFAARARPGLSAPPDGPAAP
ncbi:MAG: MarR family transcriptional regulator [Nocardioides sp.]|nr:MarR family transcriptional regulator [Nocardioides sp.]